MAPQAPSSVAAVLGGPRLNALERRILLGAASGLSREDMARAPEAKLDLQAIERYESLVSRRECGEPIAYLVGHREFYGREFMVDARVLIPRPETELLVDLALAELQGLAHPKVLDLGTGSGCLAITISLQCPKAQVAALDVSAEALDVARLNAKALGASIEFFRADLARIDETSSLLGRAGEFDLVLANPPYIAADDPHLRQGDLRFEPKLALTDGDNGFALIDACIALAARQLRAGAAIWLEHGHDQAQAVRRKLTAGGFFAPRSCTDLAGIERVTGALREDPALSHLVTA